MSLCSLPVLVAASTLVATNAAAQQPGTGTVRGRVLDSQKQGVPAQVRLVAIAEALNLFNVTNILGTSNQNYSGFVNALVRDSNDPADPGYLRSSRFGTPVSTADGVFGSGGPRALQFGARVF